MRSKMYTITILVTAANAQKGISNLRVEAWDKDSIVDDLIGSAVTNAAGIAAFEFTGEYFRERFLDRRPDLYFKIFRKGELIASTQETVLWNINTAESSITIELPPGIAAQQEENEGNATDDNNCDDGNPIHTLAPGGGNEEDHVKITGSVFQPNGTPVTGVDVSAWKIILRDAEKITSSTTDAKGRYVLNFTKSQLYGAANTAPAVVIRVANKSTGAVLSESPMLFTLNDSQEIDIIITAGKFTPQSEFEHTVATITPLLGSLKIADLRENADHSDISFITGYTGKTRNEINDIVNAHVHEKNTGVPAPAVYAMMRDNGGRDIKALLSADKSLLSSLLDRAASQNRVAPFTDTAKKDIFRTIDVKLATDALKEKPAVAAAPLGDILKKAIGDATTSVQLLADYAGHEGDAGGFWNKAKANYGEADINKLQRVLQFAGITGSQPAMIDALLADKEADDLRKLARRDANDWYTIIDKASAAGSPAVPPAFTGGDEEAAKKEYAAAIAKLMSDSFPTNSFAGSLKKNSPAAPAFDNVKTDLDSFFLRNLHFDFRKHSTFGLDESNKDFDFSTITAGNIPRVVGQLQSIQRLFPLTTDYTTIAGLKTEGLDSARAISQLPESVFAEQYGSLFGGSEAAKKVHAQASLVNLKSTELLAQIHPNLRFGFAVTGNGKPEPVAPLHTLTRDADPDLRTLFGSLEQCGCEDCQSMFSPSAYFTDILNFLLGYKNAESDVYKELVRRRPDLLKIELTCKNANTPLPYVDLVNELLENRIITARKLDTGVPESYQTDGLPEELAANPGHVYRKGSAYTVYDKYTIAYSPLQDDAVYPYTLPFNYPLEEARIYLSNLGMSRADLLQVFYPLQGGANFTNDLNDFLLAAEMLGISPEEAVIITNMSEANPWLHYGFDKETGFTPVADPADSSNIIDKGSWSDVLQSRVDVFLQQTGLSYIQLLELLSTVFIDKGGTVSITAVTGAAPDTCHLDELMLKGLTAGHLKKIYRFIRLWKKSGLHLYQLDRLVTAYAITDLKDTDLVTISKVLALQKRLGVPLETVLVCWSNIDTVSYTNFGDDPVTINVSQYEKRFRNKSVVNPPDDAFTKDAASLTGKLKEHLPGILAALQLTGQDYQLLADKLDLTDGDLTIGNLSRLLRYAVLVQALGLTMNDFVLLHQLIYEAGPGDRFNTTKHPFTSVVETASFLDQWDQLRDMPFSIAEIAYLLQHRFGTDKRFVPEQASIGLFLTNLRTELVKAGEGVNSAAEIAKARKEMAAQRLAAQLQLSRQAVSVLLGNGDPAFADPDFINGKEDLVKGDSLSPKSALCFKLYSQLYKGACIISRLHLDESELAHLQQYYSKLGTINLQTLPNGYDGPDKATTRTTGLRLLTALVKARDTLPFGSPGIILITAAAAATTPSKKDWLLQLQAQTGWKKETIEALTGNGDDTSGGLLKASFPADFVTGNLFLRLKEAVNALNKLGLPLTLVQPVLKKTIKATDSAAVKNAAKAKYGDEAWLKVAKGLRDPLREKQRQALVAYTIANPARDGSGVPAWRNADELYEFLLIDVEMQPCMVTSRIRQAISSVQLYLDRVLMNLEKYNGTTLQLDTAMAQQWKQWRHLYRVWEANRKVFLYPENWIEPELRDDKTPFFKDLEAQIIQNAVTAENVEDAVHTYLEKLDEVAHLEIAATYHEKETDPVVDILHVFARRKGIPQQYFYRKFENRVWSPWEKVEVDIQGDHITPVVWNRRFYIFWATFKIKPNPTAFSLQTGTPYYEPVKHFEMRLYWSEKKKGKWTGKRSSKNEFALTLDGSNSDDSMLYYQGTLFISPLINTKTGSLLITLKDRSSYWISSITEKYGFELTDNGCEPVQLSSAELPYNEMLPPTSTLVRNMKLTESPTSDHKLHKDVIRMVLGGASAYGYYTILDKSVPGLFSLTVPTNSSLNPLDEPFFYEDKVNTYFVSPFTIQIDAITAAPLADPNNVNLTTVNYLGQKYFGVAAVLPAPQPPVVNPLDQLLQPDDGHTTVVAAKGGYYQLPYQLYNNGTGINKRDVLTPGENIHFANAQTARPNTGSNENAVRSPRELAGQDRATIVSPYTDASLVWEKFIDLNLFLFSTFYHPHVKTFIRALNRYGIEGMLTRKVQDQPDTMAFATNYAPKLVPLPYPTNQVDFSFSGSYSIYNWELFFHVPMMIAVRLSQDQQFEEARKWFHYIFNPTTSEGGSRERFWQFLPFYNEAKGDITTLDELLKKASAIEEQIARWEENPFNPFLVARMRTLAFMKNVVMKYLDNLVAWGDKLFSTDTIESINEATLLYVLAAKILGPRPQEVPARAETAPQTFDDLKKGPLDRLSNALVQIELFFSPNGGSAETGTADKPKMQYFCIPKNSHLLTYWDTVSDRLFKIRHCMNISGMVRSLALYDPPIDPGMLVRATAAGIDLGSVISDLTTPPPHYRFTVMLQKANELCNDVKALGGALLAALEKKDSEALALLRQTHEQKLLAAIKDVKTKQLNEAQVGYDALSKTREVIQLRYQYYSTRPYMNAQENQYLNTQYTSLVLQAVQGTIETLSGVLSAIPDIKVGSPFSVGASFGGSQLGMSLRAVSTGIGVASSINSAIGAMSATKGGYDRRMDDWKFQAQTAQTELEQIEKQLLASQIRVAITEKELSNQELQMEHSAEISDYLQSKFTGQQLYSWMSGKLSALYFQTYQLAYDLARRAEKCYSRELGETSSFIRFGYWDSLNKGLLSGEQLQYDLRRMEASYFEKNQRELELVKNVSLALLNPKALATLKSTGRCDVTIPEEYYDLDYPGHYSRRIKSVSLSIPSVTGPYTTIACTLTLGKQVTRLKGVVPAKGYAIDEVNTEYFRVEASSADKIAASSAQNDAGLFELNFRDERYLPFEGAGAISTWTIRLADNTDAAALRTFDYSTISDVILHVRYTAKDGGDLLKSAAMDHLKALLGKGLANNAMLGSIFSLKHDFSTEWHRYFYPPAGKLPLSIVITTGHLPLFVQQYLMTNPAKKVKVSGILLNAVPKTGAAYSAEVTLNGTAITKEDGKPYSFVMDNAVNYMAERVYGAGKELLLGNGGLSFTMTKTGAANFLESDINDVYLVLNYVIG